MEQIEQVAILLIALALYMRLTGHKDWFHVFATAGGSVMGAWVLVFVVVLVWGVLFRRKK